MTADDLPPALQTVIATVVKAERRRARKQADHARKDVFAALGEVFVKSLPSLFSKAAQHAPAGGVTVQGKEYVGGQFIPAEVMAEATAEERAAVEGKAADKPADADPDRKAITDRLDGFGSAEDLEAEHDDLHEELHERMLAADDDDEADRLADLIAFADEELERLKQEMADSDVQVVEDDDTEDTAREELAAGEWHPVHAEDWLSEDAWPHEDPAEAAWDFRKSQAANRARFEKQLAAQTSADAAQVADFAAQAEARVKDLTGDDTDAATIREFAKDATAAIEDATAAYTTAAADYYDADKEAYKAEQKVPDGAMSASEIDALESAADRYREMRLKAAEKLPPADRDAEVERIEQQHESRLSGVDRRAAKLKDKADQLAAVRDEQAARYESARSAYADTIREQVAAIQSAVADIANGFTGRTAKSITRFAKSLGLSLQLADLKEGVRRGHAPDVWAWDDLIASVGDEMGLERVTKADRSHLVRKVIRNRLGRRQVVWVKPQDAEKADRGIPVGEDGKPTGEKPQPVAKTREQLAESRSVLAAAVNDPDRLNPEQVRSLADHIDAITKDEAKGLLKQLGAKVGGDQMAVAGRLLEAIRAGRGAGGVGEALKRAGNKTTGQYGAWGQAAGGGEKPVSRDTLPKRGVSAEEAAVERARLAKEAEQGGKSRDFSGKKKTKKRKAATGASLAEVVKSYGGIDPNSHALKAHFGNMKEAMEYGLSLGMFKKGGRGFDQMAQELESSGHIQVPEGTEPTQYLADQLMKKASSDLYDRKDELEKAEQDYYAAMQAAADEQGITYEYNPDATAEDIFGDVPGFAEAHRGAENDAAEEAASDPFGISGQGNERPEEGVNATHVNRMAQANHANDLNRMKPGSTAVVGGYHVTRNTDGTFAYQTGTKTFKSGTAEEVASHIRGQWEKQGWNSGRIGRAMDRADSTIPGTPFDPDYQERERAERRKMDALPEGVEGVSLEGPTKGRVGTVRRDENGRLRLHFDDAPDEYAADEFEPLEEKHSWRTAEITESRKKPTAATRDMFDDFDNSVDITPEEFDRRMSQIDPRDSGRVEVPEPVRPLEADDADRERYDAARERLDRMQAWQADKPDDLRAEEQVRRAEGRLREVVGEEGEPRREPVARPVAGGPRPVAELTNAEIEAERRALPRNRRTPAQYERELELSRENARRNPIPPGGGTPYPLLGGGPGPGSNDRSDERTAQQTPTAGRRRNYQTLRKQAAEGMAAGAAAMQQPHDGSGLPDIPLYAPLSAEQRADLDAQRRAAKTRQEARGVELLASQMAAEAASARRSDAAKAASAPAQNPSGGGGRFPGGTTTPQDIPLIADRDQAKKDGWEPTTDHALYSTSKKTRKAAMEKAAEMQRGGGSGSPFEYAVVRSGGEWKVYKRRHGRTLKSMPMDEEAESYGVDVLSVNPAEYDGFIPKWLNSDTTTSE